MGPAILPPRGCECPRLRLGLHKGKSGGSKGKRSKHGGTRGHGEGNWGRKAAPKGVSLLRAPPRVSVVNLLSEAAGSSRPRRPPRRARLGRPAVRPVNTGDIYRKFRTECPPSPAAAARTAVKLLPHQARPSPGRSARRREGRPSTLRRAQRLDAVLRRRGLQRAWGLERLSLVGERRAIRAAPRPPSSRFRRPASSAGSRQDPRRAPCRSRLAAPRPRAARGRRSRSAGSRRPPGAAARICPRRSWPPPAWISPSAIARGPSPTSPPAMPRARPPRAPHPRSAGSSWMRRPRSTGRMRSRAEPHGQHVAVHGAIYGLTPTNRSASLRAAARRAPSPRFAARPSGRPGGIAGDAFPELARGFGVGMWERSVDMVTSWSWTEHDMTVLKIFCQPFLVFFSVMKLRDFVPMGSGSNVTARG